MIHMRGITRRGEEFPLRIGDLLSRRNIASGGAAAFSFAQYKKNREYRAAIGFLLLLLVFVVRWRLRSL